MKEWEKGLEKNQYYPLKPLQSADFLLEQGYGARARALLAAGAAGRGVVCGLRVTAGDGVLRVAPGCAVDAAGNCIYLPHWLAVDGPAVGKTRFLTLAYRETPSAPRTLNDGTVQYDRVREGFGFALRSEQPAPCAFLRDWLPERALLETEDVRVTLQMPRCLWRGQAVRLRLRVQLGSGVDWQEPWSLALGLTAPGFCLDGRRDELRIEEKRGSMPNGAAELCYWLLPAAGGAPTHSVLLCAEGGCELQLMRTRVRSQKDQLFKLVWREGDPGEAFLREQEGGLPDDENTAGRDELLLARVCNAAGRLQIEDRRSFAPGSAAAGLARQLAGWYAPLRGESEAERVPAAPPGESCGLTELDAPPGGFARGGVYVTPWIVHGLGACPVQASCAFMLAQDEEPYICYAANAELFADQTDFELPDIELAVRVDEAQGRLQIAVRFRRRWSENTLCLRWQAHALAAAGERTDRQRLTGVEPVRTVLRPGGQTVFSPVFADKSARADCIFRASGGQIRQDGCYAAPLTEGVYEIEVERAGHSGERAMAVAIVEDNA